MEMASKCGHCGELAVDDTEIETVCHACGTVVDDIKFVSSELNPSVKRFIPHIKSQGRFLGKKKPSLSLTHGLSILDNLCHINNISSRWKTEVKDLFTLVTSVRRFKPKEDAGVAVACCLFLLLRRYKQAIAINTLCNQVPCTKGKFSIFLKFLRSCLTSDNKFKQYSFLLETKDDELHENETDAYLTNDVVSLIRVVCDKARPEEKSELLRKTTKLVKLASCCWILTGRAPKGVVVASAYLCWKSMSPFRKKASFTQFCTEFDVIEPLARLRIPELKALLLELGKKIPSYNENYVNEDNFLFHLNTILEHSETLRNDLYPNLYTKEAIDSEEYSAFRIPVSSMPRQEPTSGVVQYDENMNASDIEISDSEIESYIIPESKKNVIEVCEKIKLERISKKVKCKPPCGETVPDSLQKSEM